MNLMKTLPAALLLAVLAGCSSGPQSSERRRIPVVYEHTFEFMWEEVQAELEKGWYLEEAQKEKKILTSQWQEQLSPMGHKGHRHRIKVFIEGRDGEGYTVDAVQETELNTNDRNPLSSTDAEWSGAASDGALADRFLIALARRMYPRMEWKREMIR